MTYQEAEEIVKEVKYKAGWKLQLTEHSKGIFGRNPLIELRIVCNLVCIHKNESTKFGQTWSLKISNLTQMKKRTFIEWVGSKIHEIETHEFREWFKHNNETVYDPHPELKKVA